MDKELWIEIFCKDDEKTWAVVTTWINNDIVSSYRVQGATDVDDLLLMSDVWFGKPETEEREYLESRKVTVTRKVFRN